MKTKNIYQSSDQYHEKDDDLTEKIRKAKFYSVKRKPSEFSHVNGKIFDFDAWHNAHFQGEYGSSIRKRRSISWNKNERTFTEKRRHSTDGLRRESAGGSTQASTTYVNQNKSNKEIEEKVFLAIIISLGAFTFALKCYEYSENHNERMKKEQDSNKNE